MNYTLNFRDVQVLDHNGRYWDEKADKMVKASLAQLLDYKAYCLNWLNMSIETLNSRPYTEKTEKELTDQLYYASYWARDLAMVDNLIDRGVYAEVDNYAGD